MTTPGSGQVRNAPKGVGLFAAEEPGGANGDPLLLITSFGAPGFWWPDAVVAESADCGFRVACPPRVSR
jgi:hypothetical protein